ncbi:aquaporin-like protein [Infundibulicybe gibba]|nr:aquaporin-like protein [Infundibulicybe gibba]
MKKAPVMLLKDILPRPGYIRSIERQRNKRSVHWAAECFAEWLGVFFYVYAGMGSTATLVVSNIAKQPNLSSLTQIGLGYAFGIILAIVICGATSGGHFNPAVTIAHMVFRKFPFWKGMRYIFFQILGSYVASLVVYAQFKSYIDVSLETLAAAGTLDEVLFTANGPAGIFALYLVAPQTMGRVFLTEFVSCFVLAIVIWACIDPSNVFIPPPAAPFIIAFAYAAVIWGFGLPGVALNTARDIGTPGGGSYAALTALTNIPAMLLGVFVYETILMDSTESSQKHIWRWFTFSPTMEGWCMSTTYHKNNTRNQ